MKKSVFYNTSAQLMGKFVSMTLTVLATILITRMFGKEGYGQFSLMQTLPALFYILADFGLNTTALKRIGSDEKKEAQKYYQTVLGLRLLLSLIFIAILNTVTLFLPYSPFLKTGILLSSLLVLTQTLYASTNLIFQYKQRYDLSTIGYVGGSVVTILLIVVFMKLGLDIRLLSFTYVLGGAITFAINAQLLKKMSYHTFTHCGSSLIHHPEIAKELIKGSLPLGLMFIFSQINFKADAVLLSLLKLPLTTGLSNIESVAIYSLPYKVFEVALVLPTFFMNAVYPIFVRKFKEGQNGFALIFKKTAGYLFVLGLITSIVLYVASPLVVKILGGQEFARSTEVLKILAVGLFIFFLTQPISYLIVTLDRQKYLPATYLASAVFNVSTNLIFIPKYSFYASAYITWVSEGLILLMLTFFAVKSWREHYASR